MAMFGARDRLCWLDTSILHDLFQRCPGEVAIIQKYDPIFQAQPMGLAPDCQLPQSTEDGALPQRPMMMIADEASPQCEDFEWEILAVPGNVPLVYSAAARHEAAHGRLKRDVKQELDAYFSQRPDMVDRNRIHNQFRVYLLRFVAGHGVYEVELLNAWTRFLSVVVSEKPFFKKKWRSMFINDNSYHSNSRFEHCLGRCLGHIQNFAAASADAPLTSTELRCPYRKADVQALRNTYDDPDFESNAHFVAGVFFRRSVGRNWKILLLGEAYSKGLIDGRTLSENVLGMAADAGAYAVVAPVVVPVAGVLASKCLAEGLGRGAKFLIRHIPGFGRSSRTARAQQALSLLGLGHWQVSKINPEDVLAQLRNLGERGEDSVAVWMAYDYIRDYMPDAALPTFDEAATATSMDKYQLDTLGIVALEKETGKPVRMKTCSGLDARREIESLVASGSHRNIIELFDAFRTSDDKHMLVLECPAAQSFSTIMQLCATSAGCLERRAVSWMQGLLSGVAHLHSRSPAPIVHRGLCCETLILCRGPADSENALDWSIIKIADLGKARVLPEGQRLVTVCGDRRFMAPEMQAKEAYDAMVDMWAVGVLLTHILYAGSSPASDVVDVTLREKRWPESGELALNLASMMLRTVPRRRIRAADAVHHPWISEGNPTDST